ncbi:hypothetical protein EGI32_15935 [Ferruginibacter sp. HRS2-29]|nr:hypothetical protein [Ferruginibacter sp. HRS2-29]
MLMPGRKYSVGIKYRYGFNGHETSDEIKAEGNSYTAEFWEYDPRLGRRWNTDPVEKEDESPYACFSNNPITFIDPDGARDTVATSLESNQFADAIKIGYNEVANNIKAKKLFHNEIEVNRMLASVEASVDEYANSNSLTLQQGLEMQGVAKSYFNQFFAVADWSTNSLKEYLKPLTATLFQMNGKSQLLIMRLD